jgi:hypothetical protein
MAEIRKDAECRLTGHKWPYKPGMFSDDLTKPEPGTDVCDLCGLTRVIDEDGNRKYIYPKVPSDG